MEEYNVATARKTDFSLQVDAHARGMHNTLDEPKSSGGANTGLNPVELELGSLGASLQETAKRLARQKNFDYRKLTINLEGDLDFRGFMGDPKVRNGFQEIRIDYTFETDQTPVEVEAFVKAVEENSPIFDTLSNGTKVNIKNVIRE